MFVPEDNAIAVDKVLASRKALFIGAHPDDIEFRAGGLVYLMRQRGVGVTFAIATRGGKGFPGPIRRPLERTRVRQQNDAGQFLGGAEFVFFNYPDGKLSAFVEPLADNLKGLIADLQPNLVLCWDPDHIFSAHPDHEAAADAARAASGAQSTCWYGTTQPDLWVGMDEEALEAKVRALKAHKTETPWFYFDMRLKKRMIASMRREGAKIGRDYAETFRCSR